MASTVPALPLLASSLQASYATVQFVVSAYLLGLGLFQPLQGLLSDRYGRRPVLLAGYAVFVVASLAASLADDIETVILARFLQAMGISVATVVTRAIVRDSFAPGPAATALSFITAVMGVAPVVAPVVGGLASETVGWRGIFWMHAAVAGCVLALLFGSLRETRPTDTRAMSLAELAGGARALLRERGFVGHTLTYSSVSAAGFLFITIGAALYGRLFDLSSGEFGALWSLLAVSYVLGATACGHLSRRLGIWRTTRLGLLCNVAASALFLLAAFLPTPYFALYNGSLSLLMVANGMLSPLALSGAVEGDPQLAGVAAGLSSSIAMLLSMVSVVLAGVLYDGTARGCALLMTLACLLCWRSATIAHRARSGDGRPPPTTQGETG